MLPEPPSDPEPFVNTAVQVTPLSTPANGSVTAAPVTSLGPLFAIAIVYDTNWPATTGLTVTLSSVRSTTATTIVSHVAVRGLSGSVGLVTVAVLMYFFVRLVSSALDGTVYVTISVAELLLGMEPTFHTKSPVGVSGVIVPWLSVITPSTSPSGHMSVTTTSSAAEFVLLFVTVIVYECDAGSPATTVSVTGSFVIESLADTAGTSITVPSGP